MPDRVVPAVEFVGRTEELAVLAAEFDSAVHGQPRTACISGEPGIGKTHLVREFLRGAGPHRLVWASGEQAESELAYGVADQLFAALGERAPAGRPGRDGSSGAPADPLAVGAALLSAITDVATVAEPVVMVIDQFDLADRESADALLFLLRRLRSDPVLTIITTQPYRPYRYRGSAPDTGWWRFLTDPASTTRLPLAGLRPDDLALLAHRLGHDDLTRGMLKTLHGHTGGHPLHFRSLLDEVGVARLTRMPRPLPAPRSFTGTIQSRFDALSPSCRGLVAAGAVLGSSFAPEHAADVGGVSDVAAAVDEARDAGMLQLRPDGAGFPDELTHAAVYHGMPAGRRRELHQQAIRVTSGSVALRHRSAAAAGYDVDLAGELMVLAAAQAERGEYPEAAESLMRAARLTEWLPMREQLLLRAVAVMCLSTDPGRAEMFRGVVQACADGPQRTLVLGLMAFVGGRVIEAQALLNRIVDADPSSVPEVQRTRAAVPLAFACLQRGDWKAALAAADVAGAGSLDWERSVALTAAVLALARLGRTRDALTRVEEFRLSEPTAPGSVDLQAAHGLALLLDGDVAGAEAALARAVHRARAGEPARLPEFALTNLAEARYLLGRWDEASQDLDLAAAQALDGSRFDALLRAHAISSWIAAAQGRFSDAEGHIRAAASVTAAAESAFGVRLLAMSRAMLAEARGAPGTMLDAVAAPFAGDIGGDVDAHIDIGIDAVLSGLPNWQAIAVEALVVGGSATNAGGAGGAVVHAGAGISAGAADAVPAADGAAAVRCFAERLTDRAYQPWADDADRWRALLAEANGDLAAAENAYQQGLRRPAGALGDGLSRARLHAAYGHLLATTHRRRDAIPHLRAARARFVALRATPYRERCEQDMALCGLPVPGAAEHELLTDAERRVARLVVQGLSNRETAARLYVSAKTVEYHLGHIFAKLGITSRSELSGALAATAPTEN